MAYAIPLVLRNRDFGLLWSGQVLSQAGTRMYHIAIMWWILDHNVKNEGTVLAVFLLLAALPAVLLANFIGRIIDRHSSKSVLMTADLSAGAMIALIAYLMQQDALNLWILYTSSFFVAICEAFINPTLNKAVPELVAAQDVEAGVSFETATQSVANFSGAVAGAYLIQHVGVQGVIWINSISYLISTVLNLLARYRFAIRTQADPTTASGESKPLSGWSLLATRPLVKRILITFGLINFFANPIVLILPVYVRQTLNATATVLGNLEAALWIGLICGAMLAEKIRLQSIFLIGFVCMGIFAFMLTLTGIFVNPWIAGIGMAIGGVMIGVNNVKFVTYFQNQIEAEYKGRFFSLMQAVLGFATPLAYAAFGLLLDASSAPVVFKIQGVGICIIAFYFLWLRRTDSVRAH